MCVYLLHFLAEYDIFGCYDFTINQFSHKRTQYDRLPASLQITDIIHIDAKVPARISVVYRCKGGSSFLEKTLVQLVLGCFAWACQEACQDESCFIVNSLHADEEVGQRSFQFCR